MPIDPKMPQLMNESKKYDIKEIRLHYPIGFFCVLIKAMREVFPKDEAINKGSAQLSGKPVQNRRFHLLLGL